GFVMVVGVGGILELSRHEGGGISGDKLVGASDGALHALGIGCAEHLCAEGPHDRDLFFRKAPGDKELHFVSAIHADQRESDAGVAGGGLDDGSTGREFPILFGAADDSDGGPVFHAAAWIQVFELGAALPPSILPDACQIVLSEVGHYLFPAFCTASGDG